MHLYSGLHSFLKVRVTSTDCYSGFFFTWMSQLLNFRCLLQAKALSAPIHNACCIPISVTLYLLLVESFSLPFLLYLMKFSRPFLVCKADFSLSLSLSLSCSAWRTSLAQSLSAWRISFSCSVFLSPKGCVQNRSEANLSQKAQPLSCPALIVECLGGENIADGCDQVHCNIGDCD